MTSQIIRVLQQANLVRRSKHKGDGRAVIIEITDKGMVAARDAGAEVEAADTAFHAVLGEIVCGCVACSYGRENSPSCKSSGFMNLSVFRMV